MTLLGAAAEPSGQAATGAALVGGMGSLHWPIPSAAAAPGPMAASGQVHEGVAAAGQPPGTMAADGQVAVVASAAEQLPVVVADADQLPPAAAAAAGQIPVLAAPAGHIPAAAAVAPAGGPASTEIQQQPLSWVKQQILNGADMRIDGAPGCGKTVFLQSMKEQLRQERERDSVMVATVRAINGV